MLPLSTQLLEHNMSFQHDGHLRDGKCKQPFNLTETFSFKQKSRVRHPLTDKIDNKARLFQVKSKLITLARVDNHN